MKLSFSVRCLAACCCLRFFWCQKFTFYKKRPDAIFLAVSGVAMGASWMFLYEAYQQIGIGLSSILYYCGPVLVMALSPLLFHEPLTVHMGIGFSTVLIGIFLVNGNLFSEGNTIYGIRCFLRRHVGGNLCRDGHLQ